MSGVPVSDSKYADAVQYQWQNLDACVDEKVDRRTVEYEKYMPKETTEGLKRVCWNSWIAPHNFEGFFLNFGDMLVKAGEPEIAVTMYANARLTPDYAQWQYRDVLEDRVRNAAA